MAAVTMCSCFGAKEYKAGQRLTKFCQKNALVIANNRRDDCTHGQHQVLKTEIRLIILFVAKDGEALHGQQK